jgi:N-methylhydantoinase A
LRSGLAGSVGDDVTESAIGIFRLAAVQMAEAVQRTALNAGLDYRKTPLIVGGGAGPVHASSIGRGLDTEMLIVPAGASALCAIGALHLKPRYDAIKGLFRAITDEAPEEIARACSDLTREVSTKVERQCHKLRLSYLCDMRYQGQEHWLSIDISPSGVAAGGARYLRDLFNRMHAERRGFALDGEEIQILSVRVTAEWDAGFSVPSLAQNGASSHQPSRIRQAYDIAANAFRDFKVFSWEALQPGELIEPPAMIEMIGTTCVLTEPYRAIMDTSRSVFLRAHRIGGGP